MANMDRTDAQRLQQLDAIEDKLKKQKSHLKDIKDGTVAVANKEKAVQDQVVKINKTLKEQIELKKILNKHQQKEIELATTFEDYQKKIAGVYKRGTAEIREQMKAQGGIKEQSAAINDLVDKGKNLTGDQGDLYAEMAKISMDVGMAGLDNLDAQRDIGKESFKQVDIKEKLAKIQKLENQLQNTNFKDAAIGEDLAKQQAQDALDFVKKQYADEKALFDMRNAEHDASKILMEGANELLGEGAAELKKWATSLFDVRTFLATWIVAGAILLKKRVTEIGDAFGAIGVQNERFRYQMIQNASEARQIGKNMDSLVAISKTLTAQWGFGFEETDKWQNSISNTAKALALTDDEMTNVIAGIKTATGLGMEQSEVYAKQVARLAEMNNAAPAEVLKDIAASAEVVSKFTDSTGENIARAAIQAQRLGISLNTVGGIAESLLDFQSSIGKEVELSVLLGKQLNFQRARELALANDLKGMMDEVINQLGSEEELLKMNAIQRKAIADMIGISSADLSKMVDNQGKQLTLSEGLLQAMGISDLLGEEALSQMDAFINSMLSFAEFLSSTLVPALEPVFWLLNNTLGLLFRFAKTIDFLILPALTAWAVKAAIAAFNTGGLMSAMTLGIGVAAIIAGAAAWNSWMNNNKPKRYANLPQGEVAHIQSGVAIADAGESIVHQSDLGAGSKEVVDAIGSLKGEMVAVKNALTSLELRTSVSNKDLNIVMTPQNA